jgi:hypothetical protein
MYFYFPLAEREYQFQRVYVKDIKKRIADVHIHIVPQYSYLILSSSVISLECGKLITTKYGVSDLCWKFLYWEYSDYLQLCPNTIYNAEKLKFQCQRGTINRGHAVYCKMKLF